MTPASADGWRRLGSKNSAVRSAVLRFTAFSLVAFVLLTLGTYLIAERIARNQALDYARSQGEGVARRLAAPLVNRDVRQRRAGSTEQLESVLGMRMADGSIRRIKLWDSEGEVIWSDERDLIGRRFELRAEVAELFGTREVMAEVSSLSRAENAKERSEEQLLEVYAGQFDADGVPMVFEAYLPVEHMEREARTIVAAFVPVVVGALVLFLMFELPLAVSLSRRIQNAELERSKMMRHALLASDLERRRMAAELHDGVIQDLAGLGYALPTAARELRDGGNLTLARTLLDRATGIIQQDGSLLRQLMTEIYPPDLEDQGLQEAIRELVQSLALEAGLTADLAIAPELTLPPDGARLAYRVVREGMRNVVKHADARRVTVEIGQDSDQVLVRITDDGRGPGPEPGVSPQGHLGLRLLTDTIRDFGGRLQLRPGATGGATLEARFPVALVPNGDR